jgi:hypothetical protein
MSELRAVLVVRMTSSHATLCLAAGTVMLPASSRKSGVRAKTARLPSTRYSSSSPCSSPSASRTTLGTVTCPFVVTFAVASMTASPCCSQ